MVCPSGQLNVAHCGFRSLIPQVVAHGMAADRLECGRGDKVMGVLGHNNLNQRTGLYELAHKHGGFIRSNTPAHAKQNVFARKV